MDPFVINLQDLIRMEHCNKPNVKLNASYTFNFVSNTRSCPMENYLLLTLYQDLTLE